MGVSQKKICSNTFHRCGISRYRTANEQSSNPIPANSIIICTVTSVKYAACTDSIGPTKMSRQRTITICERKMSVLDHTDAKTSTMRGMGTTLNQCLFFEEDAHASICCFGEILPHNQAEKEIERVVGNVFIHETSKYRQDNNESQCNFSKRPKVSTYSTTIFNDGVCPSHCKDDVDALAPREMR